MDVGTHLESSTIAAGQESEVTLCVDLVAPDGVDAAEARAGASFQVVLDRRGALQGPSLDTAIDSLVGLLQRLDRRDNFGVVAFDDEVRVVVPAGPLVNREATVERLHGSGSGGATDLSQGYLRGLAELGRVAGGLSHGDGEGGRVLVISDGRSPAGVDDPAALGDLARHAYAGGIVTSTLGYGSGYDEQALTSLAKGGSGNHHFAHDAAGAARAIAAEVTDLLATTVKAVTVTVALPEGVRLTRLYNDLPVADLADGRVAIAVGDLASRSTRRLLLGLAVTPGERRGAVPLASVEVRYVDLPAHVEQHRTVSVSVDVLPAHEAPTRPADPVVRAERLFQEGQALKQRAAEALVADDADARALLVEAISLFGEAAALAPAPLQSVLRDEIAATGALRQELASGDPGHLRKLALTSFHRHNRRRGQHSLVD